LIDESFKAKELMMKYVEQTDPTTNHDSQRRHLLNSAVGVAVTGAITALGFGTPDLVYAAALTKEQRDMMTPDQIIDDLKKGNDRFRHNKSQQHDYLAQKKASISGQFPAAIILSCIDSRAPSEILFDTGIGETYVTRVAGNIANTDILGGMEYACAVTGAKVIVVMGHTSCGAVKGAIDDVKLGNLTELLTKIKPAVEATNYMGERLASNSAFVDAVAKTNVNITVSQIRQASPILAGLEKEGKLKIVGAMYSLNGGKVEFFS
jgi:carbonic anhydrase